MAKKDFDIDFDFDEAYGFDAKSFAGDEAFDDSVNMDEFSDEELGLSPKDKQSQEDDFDLDGVDAAMAELEGYRMPEDLAEDMDALRAAVADVAMEEVMDLCHAMVDKLG